MGLLLPCAGADAWLLGQLGLDWIFVESSLYLLLGNSVFLVSYHSEYWGVQVLIGAGRGRQDLEDAQEVQQLGQLQFTPLPTFCPLNQPGAASVSMKNAIALVNR